MADRPHIKPGEWIKVAHQECLVTEVTEDGGAGHQCEVIFNPGEPRHSKVTWDGEEWVFPETGESGYAETQPRLGMYVRKLKSGRS